MAASDGGAERTKRGALKLTLTEPETVPMTPEQHHQAVRALSAMILTWLQRQRGAPRRILLRAKSPPVLPGTDHRMRRVNLDCRRHVNRAVHGREQFVRNRLTDWPVSPRRGARSSATGGYGPTRAVTA